MHCACCNHRASCTGSTDYLLPGKRLTDLPAQMILWSWTCSLIFIYVELTHTRSNYFDDIGAPLSSQRASSKKQSSSKYNLASISYLSNIVQRLEHIMLFVHCLSRDNTIHTPIQLGMTIANGSKLQLDWGSKNRQMMFFCCCSSNQNIPTGLLSPSVYCLFLYHHQHSTIRAYSSSQTTGCNGNESDQVYEWIH